MVSAAVQQRFWSKVDKTDTCWLWIAGTTSGYGHFWLSQRHVLAHRLSYEWLKGVIPTGLTLDHLCRTPLCVNPEHLEAVTHKENCLRGVSPWAKRAKVTHCPQGHVYDEVNTLIKPQGNRGCRTCRRATFRKWYYRRKREMGGDGT